jgi:hypothetical protein
MEKDQSGFCCCLLISARQNYPKLAFLDTECH